MIIQMFDFIALILQRNKKKTLVSEKKFIGKNSANKINLRYPFLGVFLLPLNVIFFGGAK